MNINCVDNCRLSKFTGKKLLTLSRYKPYRYTMWRGETDDGLYIVVKYKRGFLYVGIGDTEMGAEASMNTVGTTDDVLSLFNPLELSTQDVLDFLEWDIDENNILDW